MTHCNFQHISTNSCCKQTHDIQTGFMQNGGGRRDLTLNSSEEQINLHRLTACPNFCLQLTRESDVVHAFKRCRTWSSGSYVERSCPTVMAACFQDLLRVCVHFLFPLTCAFCASVHYVFSPHISLIVLLCCRIESMSIYSFQHVQSKALFCYRTTPLGTGMQLINLIFLF